MKVMWKVIINNLFKLCPIKGKKAIKAAKFIINLLEKYNIGYDIQKITNYIPSGKSKLKIDGENIECIPACFISGKIEEKNIVSNILPLENLESPLISFNPYCKEFSLVSFYFTPSINIRGKDVKKIIVAKEIKGKVKIKKEKIKAINISVGNIKNPKNLIISHYDTVLNGAVDNLSGISVMLDIIINKKEKILKNNLFVFCGSEELSYNKPIYWGYGYRKFEEEFFDVFIKTKNIFVIDCIGFDKPYINKDEKLNFEAFPISNFQKIKNKIHLITSITSKNMKNFYSFYHSNLDVPTLLKEEYMENSIKLLIKKLIK